MEVFKAAMRELYEARRAGKNPTRIAIGEANFDEMNRLGLVGARLFGLWVQWEPGARVEVLFDEPETPRHSQAS